MQVLYILPLYLNLVVKIGGFNQCQIPSKGVDVMLHIKITPNLPERKFAHLVVLRRASLILAYSLQCVVCATIYN